MNLVDQWTTVAAAVAAASLALRGEFLKPNLRQFASAPTWVFLSLIGLSIVLGARVVSLIAGGRGTAWEAACYSALALCACVMLANIVHQRRRSASAIDAWARRRPPIMRGHRPRRII